MDYTFQRRLLRTPPSHHEALLKQREATPNRFSGQIIEYEVGVKTQQKRNLPNSSTTRCGYFSLSQYNTPHHQLLGRSHPDWQETCKRVPYMSQTTSQYHLDFVDKERLHAFHANQRAYVVAKQLIAKHNALYWCNPNAYWGKESNKHYAKLKTLEDEQNRLMTAIQIHEGSCSLIESRRRHGLRTHPRKVGLPQEYANELPEGYFATWAVNGELWLRRVEDTKRRAKGGAQRRAIAISRSLYNLSFRLVEEEGLCLAVCKPRAECIWRPKDGKPGHEVTFDGCMMAVVDNLGESCMIKYLASHTLREKVEGCGKRTFEPPAWPYKFPEEPTYIRLIETFGTRPGLNFRKAPSVMRWEGIARSLWSKYCESPEAPRATQSQMAERTAKTEAKAKEESETSCSPGFEGWKKARARAKAAAEESTASVKPIVTDPNEQQQPLPMPSEQTEKKGYFEKENQARQAKGDFGSQGSTTLPRATEKEEEAPKTPRTIKLSTAYPDEEDTEPVDWGDFVSAQPGAPTHFTNPACTTEEDEEWGDFESAEPSSSTTPVSPTPTTTTPWSSNWVNINITQQLDPATSPVASSPPSTTDAARRNHKINGQKSESRPSPRRSFSLKGNSRPRSKVKSPSTPEGSPEKSTDGRHRNAYQIPTPPSSVCDTAPLLSPLARYPRPCPPLVLPLHRKPRPYPPTSTTESKKSAQRARFAVSSSYPPTSPSDAEPLNDMANKPSRTWNAPRMESQSLKPEVKERSQRGQSPSGSSDQRSPKRQRVESPRGSYRRASPAVEYRPKPERVHSSTGSDHNPSPREQRHRRRPSPIGPWITSRVPSPTGSYQRPFSPVVSPRVHNPAHSRHRSNSRIEKSRSQGKADRKRQRHSERRNLRTAFVSDWLVEE